VAASFVAEVMLTMFLVLTVLGATDAEAPAGFAGLAIELVLTLISPGGYPDHKHFGEWREASGRRSWCAAGRSSFGYLL
jgi:hypothetical protein